MSEIATNRPKYSYDVPESCRLYPTDPKEVTLQPITLGEEQQAFKVAQATGSGSGLAYELIKHAIVAADGKPVTWESAGKDRWLESLSPTVRQLVMSAYDAIHNPPAETTKGFLAGRKIAV